MKNWFEHSNRKLVREITIILVIKVICLLMIKSIWFDAPTIPKGIEHQVAEHIAGQYRPVSQESSR